MHMRYYIRIAGKDRPMLPAGHQGWSEVFITSTWWLERGCS